MSNVKDQELNKFRTRNGSTVVAIVDASYSDAYISIMNSSDRIKQIYWLDFGTKDSRVNYIEYSSPSYGSASIRYTFNYTLIGNQYRLDGENISII